MFCLQPEAPDDLADLSVGHSLGTKAYRHSLLCSSKSGRPKKDQAASSSCKEPVDDMSFQQNPLLNHVHFRKIKDLNEGTFGFVQLATDTRNNQQVRMD